MSKQKKNRNEEIKENEPIETVEDDELPAVEEEVEVVIDPLEQK